MRNPRARYCVTFRRKCIFAPALGMVTVTWSVGLPGVMVTFPAVVAGMGICVQVVRSVVCSTVCVVTGWERSLRLYSKSQLAPLRVSVGRVVVDTSGALFNLKTILGSAKSAKAR